MKKLICLLSISLLLLSSCSEEPGPTSLTADTILLKKTIDTNTDGSIVTTTFTYDGKKVVKITNDAILGTNLFFTYTGNLITKIEYKLSNGLTEHTEVFQYDAENKLKTFIRLQPLGSYGEKETYTYNSGDGSISVISYTGDLVAQEELSGAGIIYFQDGEVSRITTTDGTTHNYAYDTKNFTFKNSIGLAKISFVGGEAGGAMHNIISETTSGASDIYDFTYNSHGFPLTCTETIDGVVETNTQFFYE